MARTAPDTHAPSAPATHSPTADLAPPDELRGAREPQSSRFLVVVESLVIFAIGVTLMNFFFAASVEKPGGEIGVPEHDSFYHIAMASMIPQEGLLAKFPWLQFVYFREKTEEFVSHHVGFHLILLPFLRLGRWLAGDELAGARWAMSCFFGLNLLLFNQLLRQLRVPGRWLWLVLFFALPDQFYARHGYIKAIPASLVMMQLTLLALFSRRFVLAGLAIAAYVHVYLGAVMYGPLLVVLYACMLLMGWRDEPSQSWKAALRTVATMCAITCAGWVLGVLTHPYRAGVFEFLRLQVLGSGLSPDIEVGREWRPYTDAWFIVIMAGPLLLAWTAALVARPRHGQRLDVRETTILLLQFAFLVLMCKARRFVEYWPPLCLLSAACLAGPSVRAVQAWWRRLPVGSERSWACLVGLWVLAAAAVAATPRLRDAAWAAADWPVGLALMLGAMLAPLLRIWVDGAAGPTTLLRRLAVPASALLLAAVAVVAVRVAYYDAKLDAPRLRILPIGWGLLALAYLYFPFACAARKDAAAPRFDFGFALRNTALAVAFALGAAAMIGGFGAFRLRAAAAQLRCQYDLAAVRDAMEFLKRESQAGDVVFTDDWDIFPVYFYYNRHNYYIVGLDPKFTQWRQPELWERYVKVSRAQIPANVSVKAAPDATQPTPITVRLADIRDYFHCRWVILDRDHRNLGAALAANPDLAECVYPRPDYRKCADAAFVVFRIREGGGESGPASRAAQPER
ncbi:MAG: hypothetical protein HZB38_00715 [Planctomycetes bacterium]|nr:hypothetical protein [Planctomycetota bacterium]